MPSVFHWVKVKTICYATEDEDLLCRMTAGIAGTDELDVDVSEGLHGNPITVIDATLKKNQQYAALFRGMGPEVLEAIIDGLEDRIDDDCILYVRFDKQKAVGGVLEISHGGDVVAVTGKVMAHPAWKEVAVETVRSYLLGLLQGPPSPSPA